jgi:Helicase associated domain
MLSIILKSPDAFKTNRSRIQKLFRNRGGIAKQLPCMRDHWGEQQSNGILVRTLIVYSFVHDIKSLTCHIARKLMSVNMQPATVPYNTTPLGKTSSLEGNAEFGISLPPAVVEDSLRRISSSDCSVSTTTTITTLDSSRASNKRPSKDNRTWEDFVETLIAYRYQHGHCNVPYYYEPDRNLGEWVNRQRKTFSTLPQNQKNMLDSIGFNWQSTQERLCKKYCAWFP